MSCLAAACDLKAAPPLVDKIRMLDLAARKARKVERVPSDVIEDALARLSAVLD